MSEHSATSIHSLTPSRARVSRRFNRDSPSGARLAQSMSGGFRPHDWQEDRVACIKRGCTILVSIPAFPLPTRLAYGHVLTGTLTARKRPYEREPSMASTKSWWLRLTDHRRRRIFGAETAMSPPRLATHDSSLATSIDRCRRAIPSFRQSRTCPTFVESDAAL